MSKDNKWEMGTDQEAILENERLSFINKLPKGMSIKDYDEINEVVREYDGFTEEDWCNIDPDRMMITDYCPDSPGWSGKVCVILGGEVNFIMILIQDSKYNRFYKDEDWRVFSQQEIQQVAAIDENGITHSNVIKKIR